MEKVSYTNLKLKVNTETKSFDYKGQTIEVLQYLSIKDKYDLVMITLQKSLEDGVYNPIKIDVYFHLGLVYLYSNLNITEKQKEDEFKVYDNLSSNGLLTSILELIPEAEYEVLYSYIEELRADILDYKYTAAATIQSIVQDLPRNAQVAKDIVDSFDKEQYKEVVEFARAANGGRNI